MTERELPPGGILSPEELAQRRESLLAKRNHVVGKLREVRNKSALLSGIERADSGIAQAVPLLEKELLYIETDWNNLFKGAENFPPVTEEELNS